MTFAESLAQATKQGACALIDGFQAYHEAHRRIFGRIDPLPNPVNYWRALNRHLCNKEQPSGDEPLEGGQCPGIPYDVIFNFTYELNSSCTPVARSYTKRVFGPISGAGVELIEPPSGATAFQAYVIAYPTSDISGNPVRIEAGTTNRNNPNCSTSVDNLTIDIVRVDGLPDECPGYIPPMPPPPGWNVIIIDDFTWVNNEGDTINEGDIGLFFGYVDFNADLDFEIPVTVDIGGINFNGNFNFDKGAFDIDFGLDIDLNLGDIGIRPPGGDDRNLPPAPPGAPDNPDAVDPDPDVIEDDEPEGEEIVRTSTIRAVRVVVTDPGESVGELLQDGNPNIAIPNYGYIQFFVRTETDAGGWTQDIPVKNRNHFIPCPWEGGALFVRGTPRPGVLWSIKAYRQITKDVVAFPGQ